MYFLTLPHPHYNADPPSLLMPPTWYPPPPLLPYPGGEILTPKGPATLASWLS